MLPQLSIPLYDCTLPSGRQITFRPFLVKEEKLLLMARQADDTETMVNAIKQILTNCIQNLSESIDHLPLFDIEYLFLQLRARSIGEVVTLRYKCNGANTESNTECGTISTYPVNLLEISPKFGENHNKTIPLTKDVGVMMKYPIFSSFMKIAKEDLPADEAYRVLMNCIESVYDKEKTYSTKEIPEEELRSFLDSLTSGQVQKIDHFFESMPKIETVVHFECPKCHVKEDLLVSGLEAFFA